MAQQIYSNLLLYFPKATWVLVLSNTNFLSQTQLHHPRLNILLFQQNTLTLDPAAIEQYLAIQEQTMLTKEQAEQPADSQILANIHNPVYSSLDEQVFVQQILSSESIANE